jgi:hypothetical protein
VQQHDEEKKSMVMETTKDIQEEPKEPFRQEPEQVKEEVIFDSVDITDEPGELQQPQKQAEEPKPEKGKEMIFDSEYIKDETGELQKQAEEPHGGISDDEFNDWSERCRKQEIRLFRTRIAVVISTLFIIVNCILFCVYGTKYISDSFEELGNGLRRIKRLCEIVIRVIDIFIAQATETEERNQEAFNNFNVNGLCHKVREKLCERIDSDLGNCNFTDTPFLSGGLEKVIQFVYEAKNYVFTELPKMKEDIQDITSNIDDLLDNEQPLEWAFWVSFGFTIALSRQCFVILWGVYLAHKGQEGSPLFRFYRRHVVFPLFIFLVLCAFAFACAFIITAVGASDWCFGSPSPKVTYLLNKQQDSMDSIIYKFAKYYVNTCDSSLAPIQLGRCYDGACIQVDALGLEPNYVIAPASLVHLSD